jgi:hypothetical protein
LDGGKLAFTVAASNKASSVVAEKPVGSDWVNAVAKITADRQITLEVNGQRVGSSKISSLIPTDPNDNLQIGADTGSPVLGEKKVGNFTGLMESVRIRNGE